MTFRNYYETRVHFWRMTPLCRIVVHVFLVSLTFSCHRDGFLKCLSNLDIEKYGEANNFRYNIQTLNAQFFQEWQLHDNIFGILIPQVSQTHIFLLPKRNSWKMFGIWQPSFIDQKLWKTIHIISMHIWWSPFWKRDVLTFYLTVERFKKKRSMI